MSFAQSRFACLGHIHKKSVFRRSFTFLCVTVFSLASLLSTACTPQQNSDTLTAGSSDTHVLLAVFSGGFNSLQDPNATSSSNSEKMHARVIYEDSTQDPVTGEAVASLQSHVDALRATFNGKLQTEIYFTGYDGFNGQTTMGKSPQTYPLYVRTSLNGGPLQVVRAKNRTDGATTASGFQAFLINRIRGYNLADSSHLHILLFGHSWGGTFMLQTLSNGQNFDPTQNYGRDPYPTGADFLSVTALEPISQFAKPTNVLLGRAQGFPPEMSAVIPSIEAKLGDTTQSNTAARLLYFYYQTQGVIHGGPAPSVADAQNVLEKMPAVSLIGNQPHVQLLSYCTDAYRRVHASLDTLSSELSQPATSGPALQLQPPVDDPDLPTIDDWAGRQMDSDYPIVRI